MPKIKIYCELKSPTSFKTKSTDEYNFEFCREVDVSSSDLTTFYYEIRSYFRKNLTQEEQDQIIKHIPEDKERIKLIKRRKNIALKDVFENNYFVEGVAKISPNRYHPLWGV
jgi:hypothetical protein